MFNKAFVFKMTETKLSPPVTQNHNRINKPERDGRTDVLEPGTAAKIVLHHYPVILLASLLVSLFPTLAQTKGAYKKCNC